MTETGMFNDSARLREWWIVYRYIQLYAQQHKNIAKVSELINMYIGFSFSGAKMDESASNNFKNLTEEISKFVFDDGYLKLPDFVMDVINAESFEQVEEEEEETYDFSQDKEMWGGLKDTALMMLKDKKISASDKEMWSGALDTAKMMLKG
jgi:hypothetical protein